MAVDEHHFRAMASHVQVIVVDGPPQACATAQRSIEHLESIWSRFINSSDITRLNQANGRPVDVDPATLTLLGAMIDAHRLTTGRYNPTTLPALLNAGYRTSIDSAPRCNIGPPPPGAPTPAGPFQQPVIDRASQTATLPPRMTIDAGGIGKGLAADLVVAELLARGAAGALVSIGGDLAASGNAPNRDGWMLDIEDAFDQTTTLPRLIISGGGVATSSTLSRRWKTAGTERHHIIDPDSGAPAATDLAAVTAIAPCGWQAEAHATSLLLGGSADFDRYSHAHNIEAVATTHHGTLTATLALAGNIPTALVKS